MVPLLATLTFAALSAAVAIIDIRTYRIPDILNLLILITGFGAHYVLGLDLATPLIGAAVGYGALYTIAIVYRRVRGRDGIGMGDAKLFGASGAWIGWSGLPFQLLIAACLGLAMVSAQRIAGRKIRATDRLPFGPFLVAGALVVWMIQIWA